MQEKQHRSLLEEVLEEHSEYRNVEIPENEKEQKILLRSLFNIRPSHKISEKFLAVQDEYLREETKRKGITEIPRLYNRSAGDMKIELSNYQFDLPDKELAERE